MEVWPPAWAPGARSTWSPRSYACSTGAARPWASWCTCRYGRPLIGGKYEACRLGDSRPRRGARVAVLVGGAGRGLAVSLRPDRKCAWNAPARRWRYHGADAPDAREYQDDARVRGKLTRPRGEVHRVSRGHRGLRGDECNLCDVFPEGSTRALHSGRERARGGRAGGDRMYRGDGVDRGRPGHLSLSVRVVIQMSNPPRPSRTAPELTMNSSVRPSCDTFG